MKHLQKRDTIPVNQIVGYIMSGDQLTLQVIRMQEALL